MTGILHVPYIYYPDPVGGTEVYVESLIRALRAHGIEGTVAAPASAEASYEHGGIRVHRIAKTANAVLSHAYGAPDPLAAQSFRSVLERVRPQIVHLHAHTAAVSEALVDAAHDAGAKVVFTYHTPTVSCARGTMLLMGQEPCDGKVEVTRCSTCLLAAHGVPAGIRNLIAGMPHALGESLRALGLKGSPVTALRIPKMLDGGKRRFDSLMDKADRIVTVCGWVRELLRNNGVPDGKITLCRQGLPNGAGGKDVPAPESLAARTNGPLIIGYFGRLDTTKGVDILVEAVRRTRDTDLRLRIFGVRQSVSDRFAKQIEAAAAQDRRIVMESPVDPRAVTAAMHACDLIAVPSQLLETGPLVVYEAFAAGVPVLGSRLGGIGELVTDSVDGLLVEACDIGAWSAAFYSLAADRNLVERLRAGIRPPRTMDNVAGEMALIYRAVLQDYA